VVGFIGNPQAPKKFISSKVIDLPVVQALVKFSLLGKLAVFCRLTAVLAFNRAFQGSL
jgi:hypothetical protein